MAADIIWYVIVGGCGVLFFLIGVYARRKKTPMHFYAGTTVPSEEIADIPAYNRANGWLWQGYSLVFFLSAALWAASRIASLVCLILGSVAGIMILVICYHKIEKKYRVKT